MMPVILNPDSLTKILQMTRNAVETLEYLQATLVEKTRKSGTEYSELMNEINKIVDYATSQATKLSGLDLWSGKPDLVGKLHALFNMGEFSGFQNYMAEKLASKVPMSEITFNYQISDKAEFLRAYSVNNHALQGDVLETMDILFNSWLAQRETKMLMRDGVIYSATDQGEIMKDVSSDDIKKRVEKVKALLTDDQHGFERYVKEKNPKVQIKAIEYKAPQEQEEEQRPSQ